ncbi:hypothetical protein BV22DRAFT_1192479 [Leucogyrophana mollusca]|uniref:Uncharacterized protein n=1 Tax=Leucogyrophana mollusca TaxID=85980 RepID=A0ACB8BU78_9AGAM|nr:hypothetical protein BV22DRAFT_1192479 [Leucogyrophana mollusca]
MSTTTQILFNSPALHSLKRDQLVKLCKIHSLKASGKNKDIIARLQLHARTLPAESLLDTGEGQEEVENNEEGVSRAPRPSEQWEVVMDSIVEVDEDSQSTLRSRSAINNTQSGEFGTAGPSTKSSSVTSSIRAIASSLGLKRTKPDIVAPPLPEFPPPTPPPPEPVEPIPGHPHLPGLPAPSNARLSMTQAPTTTTIRLISSSSGHSANPDLLLSPPRLKPFATTFDLVPPTPGKGAAWPMSPGEVEREIYPAIPTFGALYNADDGEEDMDIDDAIPGGMNMSTTLNTTVPSIQTDVFSPGPSQQQERPIPRSPASTNLTAPKPAPFIFGSPLPQNNLSNTQFRSAAQSVLDEMNKRLADEGVQGLNLDVLERKRKSGLGEDGAEVGEGTRGSSSVTAMFEKAHQREFERMESITGHYAARRGSPVRGETSQSVLGKKRKSTVGQEPILPKKRKSSVVIAKNRGERKSSVVVPKRVPSTGASGIVADATAPGRVKKVIPGGFNDDDEDEEDEEERVVDRRASKRPRFDAESGQEVAQQGAVDPTPEKSDHDQGGENENAETEEARNQKERDAIRRRLDYNRAKRRSSMGRPSLGGKAMQKPKPTRFGFLSSAKSLVQNVWNRGAGTSKAAAPSSGAAAASNGTLKSKGGPSSNIPVAKSVVPGASIAKRDPSSASSGSLKPRVPSSSSSTRSPIPPFGGPGTVSKSRTGSKAPDIAGTMSRAPSIAGAGSRAPSIAGKTSIAGPVSSLGMRGSVVGSGISSSSMGTRRSTLMAPTASSLAKAPSGSLAKLPAAGSSSLAKASAPSSSTLEKKGQPMSRLPVPRGQTTGTPLQTEKEKTTTNDAVSPRGKIFSQPLMSPLGHPSFGAAAATLVPESSSNSEGPSPATAGPSSATTKPPIPPKPKILPGRRPRISRSKVIAKLAEQRAGASSTGAVVGKTRSSMGGGKIRSSMGAGAGKRSMGGGAAGGDVLMSAKRRARQSEYSRRKSVKVSGAGGSMDTDE